MLLLSMFAFVRLFARLYVCSRVYVFVFVNVCLRVFVCLYLHLIKVRSRFSLVLIEIFSRV